MYRKMQEPGLTEIIPLICILTIWGHYPVFLQFPSVCIFGATVVADGFVATTSFVYCCSVAQLCLTLCDPMDCSMPAFPVLHCLLEFAQTYIWVKDVHWVNDAIQPSHPLSPFSPHALNLALKSIRVFSNELAPVMRWPKYWSFSFSISPSNEYSGPISFRIDWFDLLTVQGTLWNGILCPQIYFPDLGLLNNINHAVQLGGSTSLAAILLHTLQWGSGEDVRTHSSKCAQMLRDPGSRSTKSESLLLTKS